MIADGHRARESHWLGAEASLPIFQTANTSAGIAETQNTIIARRKNSTWFLKPDWIDLTQPWQTLPLHRITQTLHIIDFFMVIVSRVIRR